MFTIEPCPSPKCAMTAEAGGRNVDRMQQPCCMEDGGRPSGAGYRISPQTTRRCLGISSQVVNGPGKGELDSSKNAGRPKCAIDQPVPRQNPIRARKTLTLK